MVALGKINNSPAHVLLRMERKKKSEGERKDIKDLLVNRTGDAHTG